MAVALPEQQPPAPEADAALVARAREGDERAFSLLYRRHAAAIAAAVYRLLGHDQHLDDVVQETFVLGLRRLDRLREPEALRQWLLTIAVRRVRRLLAGRYRERDLSRQLERAAPRVGEPGAREEIHALYQALEKLPDDLRIAWMLHRMEGHALPVVAELCDVSLSTVKRQVHKADHRLRRMGHG